MPIQGELNQTIDCREHKNVYSHETFVMLTATDSFTPYVIQLTPISQLDITQDFPMKNTTSEPLQSSTSKAVLQAGNLNDKSSFQLVNVTNLSKISLDISSLSDTARKSVRAKIRIKKE